MTSIREDAVSGVEREASRAARSPAMEAASRLGFAAQGGLYLIMAVLVVDVAAGKHGHKADSRGALHELARGTFGKTLLLLLTLGFAGFAVSHLVAALAGTGNAARSGTVGRLADIGRAAIYGVLCAIAVSFLVTSKPVGGGAHRDRTWTARVLSWSGGPELIAVVGAAIVIGGLVLALRGLSGKSEERLRTGEMKEPTRGGVRLLRAVGDTARGAVLMLIGGFLISAALEHDPNEAVGVDGALKRLTDQSFGPALLVLVAVGLVAFAVSCFAQARYQRAPS